MSFCLVKKGYIDIGFNNSNFAYLAVNINIVWKNKKMYSRPTLVGEGPHASQPTARGPQRRPQAWLSRARPVAAVSRGAGWAAVRGYLFFSASDWSDPSGVLARTWPWAGGSPPSAPYISLSIGATATGSGAPWPCRRPPLLP